MGLPVISSIDPDVVIQKMDTHSSVPPFFEVRKTLLCKVEILFDVLLVMFIECYKSPLGISYP